MSVEEAKRGQIELDHSWLDEIGAGIQADHIQFFVQDGDTMRIAGVWFKYSAALDRFVPVAP